jgi:decaprenylphospho-beta-D-ribofuranose 2-oxidase
MADAQMIYGWGLHGRPGHEVRSEVLDEATDGAVLSRGLGRSYGDSSLPPNADEKVAGTVLADRILAFDEQTGVLRAEAGLSLVEINRIFLPRLYFSPVTPGTQFVTLGGMVASDVHGKNHHRDGCFGEHVTALKIRLASGEIVECGPSLRTEIFNATIGGMGLTGHILEVEFVMQRIPSPWIWQESSRIPNVESYVAALKEAGPNWPMTVGWIDCVSGGSNLGRGILMRGRWAEPHEAPKHFPKKPPRVTMPSWFPSWLLNPLTILIFNTLFYWKHLPREKRGVVSPWGYFYPLDAIQHWNRMYGRRGFTQYQCVLPETSGPAGARRFLELLTRLGGASFLCVIKDCGAEGRGMLSFPMPGISVALDIPLRDWTQKVIDELNEFVIAEGGRIYLTKDTISRPQHFAAMEKRLPAFLALRRKLDPRLKIRSAQSVRMFGDPAFIEQIADSHEAAE